MSALMVHAYLKIEQSAWLLWSALSLALIMPEQSLWRRISLIFLTGFMAAVCVFITGNLISVFWVVPCLLAMTWVCVWVGEEYPHYFLSAFIINLLLVVASGWPSTVAVNSERAMSIMLGCALVLFWQPFFGPYSSFAQSQRLIKQALQQLQILNRMVFSCFLQPDYASNLYRDERLLHQEKNKVMQIFTRLRRWQGNNNENLTPLFMLYDIQLGCATLRWQVSDHTLFAVCAPELTAILKEIDHAYVCWQKGKREWQKRSLDIKIAEFEQHFHTVLNVTAKEPLVFLIFIFYLKALSEALALQSDFKRIQSC